MRSRRSFLAASSAVGVTGLAGCIGDLGGGDGGDGDDGGLPDTAEFLMSPTEPQDEMEAQYTPMADHLEGELGVDVNLQYAAGYSAVISALGSGSGHIGEMGPFAAALGVRSEELDIILQRYAFGGWDYSSVIVTGEDSDIETVADLEGKTVAFADRLSSSGALYPLYMIKNAGLNIGDLPTDEGDADFDPTFSDHTAAVEQLLSGTADAAGVGMFAAVVDGDESREEYLDGLRLVEKTQGIPRAPICVSPTLSDDVKDDITQAFLDAPDSAYEGDGGENPLWFSDVREADADTYQPVVDVANELGIEAELLDEGA